MRKDFTPSERVAIAKTIKEEIGNRKGERTDLAANAATLAGKTDDHVAKVSGFGSAETMERARKVVDHGARNIHPVESACVLIGGCAASAENRAGFLQPPETNGRGFRAFFRRVFFPAPKLRLWINHRYRHRSLPLEHVAAHVGKLLPFGGLIVGDAKLGQSPHIG